MSLDGSGISWTGGTLNSLYGCRECSSGCRLCYAVGNVYRQSVNSRRNRDGRFDGLIQIVSGKKRFSGDVLFDPGHLYKVLKDSKPKRIFVNEFSDLFADDLPWSVIREHFRVFRSAVWQQFQCLTKRAHRLREIDAQVISEFGSWPENVWQGVSICTAADKELARMDALGVTSAHIKWISFEPWISDLDQPISDAVPDLQKRLKRNGIAWTVIGGESGSKADTSLMTLEDARYLISESRAAGCKVHFKQLGTALAIRLGVYDTKLKHGKQGGNSSQWPEGLNIVEWPDVASRDYEGPVQFEPGFDAKRWKRFKNAARSSEDSVLDRAI